MKKILISVSLFYLENGYKNFNKYLNGIDEWKKIIKYKLKQYDVKLRVYYDDSIIKNDTINKKFKIKTDSKVVETKYFNYPKFKSKKGNGHISTFGTLVRFEPLFEQSNYDIIMIRDLDIYFNKNSNFKNFHNFINDDKYKIMFYKIYFLTNISTHLKATPASKYGRMFNANGTFKIRFDRKLYDNFLNDLHTKQNKKLNKILNKSKQYQKKHIEGDIGYGIDEIFLNLVLMNNTDVKVKIIYFFDSVNYILRKISKHLGFEVKEKNFNLILKKYRDKLSIELIKTLENYQNSKIYRNVIL